MKKRLLKSLYIPLIICLVIFLFPSCKKTSNNISSSLVGAQNNTSNPLLVVPTPPGSDNQEALSNDTTSESNIVVEEKSKDSSTSTVVEDTKKVETATLATSTPETPIFTSDDTLDEVDSHVSSSSLYSYVIAYDDIIVSFDSYDDYMRVELPSNVNDEDISSILTLLSQSFDYKKENNTLFLFYDKTNIETIKSYILDIEKGILSYIASLNKEESTTADNANAASSSSLSFNVKAFDDVTLFITLSNEGLVVSPNRVLLDTEREALVALLLDNIKGSKNITYDNENNALILSFDSISDEMLLEEYTSLLSLLGGYTIEEETLVVEPVTIPSGGETTVKATNLTVKIESKSRHSFLVGVNPSLYYDIKHNIFRTSITSRFAFSLFDSYSFGINCGYDFSSYILLSPYVSVDVYDSIYLKIGAGYKFDISNDKKYSSFLCELSIGYKKEIVSNLFFYGEGGIMYAPHSYSKLTPSVLLGISYKFNF